MSLTLANNVGALTAQHNLNRSSTNLNRSLERLSSGLKVNRGADGPASLVISEKQRAQIAGLRQAIENSEKAGSMVQTAEGALTEINSLLVKVRGLALDSANAGVNDDDALAANQAEITNALATIDRIASNTQFGTKKLLDGSAGLNATSTNTFITDLNASTDTTVGTFSISAVVQTAQKGDIDTSLSTAASVVDNDSNLLLDETLTFNGSTQVNLTAGMTNTQARDAINSVTNDTGVIASLKDGTGELQLTSKNFGQNFTVQSNRDNATDADQTGVGNVQVDTNSGTGIVTKVGRNLIVDLSGPGGSTLSNVVASGNVVTASSGDFNGLTFTVDADPADAAQTAAVAGANIGVADGTLTFQIGANAGQTATLSIIKASSDALGVNQANNQFSSLKGVDVTTASGSQDALAVVDAAIEDISNLRGTLGAFQGNTLESTANNLRATLENTVNAESIIRDTDFAQEITNFTKQQVLVQAGTSVLSSASQTSQLVLSLLG
ncbi:MAG: flagellin [Pirellulaceae bacterium]